MARQDLKVARRYAKALFNMSVPGRLDQMKEALSAFSAIWSADTSLREALTRPGISPQQKGDVVRAVAEQVAPGNLEFSNFLILLVQNRRISDLPAVAKFFEEITAEYKKILSLEVVSAFELPEAEKSTIQIKIREKIPSQYASLVSLSWRVQKEVIGGLMIKAGDTVLDGTLSGALERLGKQLKA